MRSTTRIAGAFAGIAIAALALTACNSGTPGAETQHVAVDVALGRLAGCDVAGRVGHRIAWHPLAAAHLDEPEHGEAGAAAGQVGVSHRSLAGVRVGQGHSAHSTAGSSLVTVQEPSSQSWSRLEWPQLPQGQS